MGAPKSCSHSLLNWLSCATKFRTPFKITKKVHPSTNSSGVYIAKVEVKVYSALKDTQEMSNKKQGNWQKQNKDI